MNMMSKYFGVLLLCALLIRAQGAGLYGVHVTDAYNETEHIVSTVSIDPTTGDFTVVVENSIVVGDALLYNSISAFDGKKNVLYYSLDLMSDDVAVVDVAHAVLLPSINIGATAVITLVRDITNEQLLITGQFADNSTGIYAVPDNGAPQELVNLTKVGVNVPVTAALNSSSGNYFLVHLKEKSYELAIFPLDSPKSFKSVAFPCDSEWQPYYIAYDPAKLVGLCSNTKNNYAYFEIANGKCTIKNLSLPGVIVSETYDPTSGTLYLSYSTPKGQTNLCTFSSHSFHLSCGPSSDVLIDVEASFSLL